VRLALRRLLLQGALRVALVAITTAGVVGFLSLIARASQSPGQMLADAKGSSRACMPSHCRARPETIRNEKRLALRSFAIDPPVRPLFPSDLWPQSILLARPTS
jgi:hypothetical protein